MGFFDLFGNNAGGDTDVVLTYASASTRIPASEAQGRTLAELFAQYADRLGINASRITGYFHLGRNVSGTTAPQLGNTYSASHNAETKGA